MRGCFASLPEVVPLISAHEHMQSTLRSVMMNALQLEPDPAATHLSCRHASRCHVAVPALANYVSASIRLSPIVPDDHGDMHRHLFIAPSTFQRIYCAHPHS